MIKIFLVSLFFFPIYAFSQIEDYFNNGKKYTYNTVYINSVGDTIIKGTVVICPTDKKWFFQPGLQKKIVLHYKSDTASNNNYIDPIPFFAKKDKKRIAKKGSIGFKKSNITGGFVNDTLFYMHPPRINQYRMLFYAPHPEFELESFNKTRHVFTKKLTLIGFGVYHHEYICTKSLTIKLFNSTIETWDMSVDSNIEYKNKKIEENELLYNDCYNSNLKAKFCREYGFINLDYKFDNNIEIKFELVKVETL